MDHLWRLDENSLTAETGRQQEVFRLVRVARTNNVRGDVHLPKLECIWRYTSAKTALIVDRMELQFDQVETGKKTQCPLRSGVIHVRTGEGTIFGSVSRGDRI